MAAGATLLVTVLPWLGFAYRSPTAHVAIETAATLTALLAALLVFGRFVRSQQRGDLWLGGALLLLGVTNLVFSMVPAVADTSEDAFGLWSPLAGRTIAALALTVAAFVPNANVLRPRRAIIRMLVAVTGVIVLIGVGVALLGDTLPLGVDADISPESSGRPRIVGPPGLLGTYIALMAIYALAAFGFLRRAERTGDELMVWFAAAMTVSAFSRLNYFLFSSIESEWVYTGDLLRLAFYLLLLTGAAREIVAYQGRLAAAAVYEERRRLARDLHDGLAQDLAFIASQSQRLDGQAGPQIAALIRQAADRALDESRKAIGALSGPPDEPLAAALSRTIEELALRGGAHVRFDLDAEASASAQTREALVRIAGEAVNNSIRHGEARNIAVSLRADDGLCLIVRDDGTGFETAGDGSAGFGLTSMRERAEALGGDVRLASPSGGGASVEVRIP